MHKNPLYRIYGSGQPLLLIPGFASRANSLGFQYRQLSKYFKNIVIEISGFNNPQISSGDHSIALIASDINSTMELYGITKMAILGSSMGAIIALEFAQQYPEKVSSLILASLPIEHSPSFNCFIEHFRSFKQTADYDAFFKQLFLIVFSSNFISKDRFKIFTNFFKQNGASFSKDFLDNQLRAVSKWRESKKWLEGCRCPCLFIYGSEDKLISLENTIKEVTTAFSGSEVKIINGAGHAVHIEKFKEFNDVVHKFLMMHNS